MFDDPNAGRGRRTPSEAPNPFTPIPYSDRLSAPIPHDPFATEPPMQPGQYYTGGWPRVEPSDTAEPTEAASAYDPFATEPPMQPGQYYTGGWPRVEPADTAEPTEAPPAYDPFDAEPPMQPGQYYTGGWPRVEPADTAEPTEAPPAYDPFATDFEAIDFGTHDFGAVDFGAFDFGAPSFGVPESAAWSAPGAADQSDIREFTADPGLFPPPMDEPTHPIAEKATDEPDIPSYLRRSRRGERGMESRAGTSSGATRKVEASSAPVDEVAQPTQNAERARQPEQSVPQPTVPAGEPSSEKRSRMRRRAEYAPSEASPADFPHKPDGDAPPDETLHRQAEARLAKPKSAEAQASEAPWDASTPQTPPDATYFSEKPSPEPFDFPPPDTFATDGFDTSDLTPPAMTNDIEASAAHTPSFDPYARFAQTDRTQPFSPEAFTGRDEVTAFFDDDPGAAGRYDAPDPPADDPAANDGAPFAPGPSQQTQSTAPFPPADDPATDMPSPDGFAPPDPARPSQPKEPIKPSKPTKAKQTAPKRRVRPSRLLALIAIAGMVLFCAVVGGGIVADLARNEREMKEFREDYLEQNGVRPEDDASRVELLPYGQTFTPTATPTAPSATPTPTPRIAMNDPAIAALNGRDNAGVTLTDAPTATPAARSKRYDYPKNPLRNITQSMQALVDEFPDVVGRLVIDGVLDEVVVQKNNTFYLTHNYRGTSSKCGAVFVDESCQLKTPPENLLLRGQSAVEGKVFAPLWQYQQAGGGFVSTAAIATLTTLYEEERYVLFAVIAAGSDPASADYFNYASYPSFSTDAEMLNYVDSVISHSLYRFNVSVAADDRLLTLATVGGENGKTLVLIFRMLREGEGAR